MSSYYLVDMYGTYISDAPYVTDNNTSTGYTLYSYLDPEMPYAVICDFLGSVNLTSISVYLTQYGGVAEYWTGSGWTTISNLTTGWNNITGLNIITTKWRVRPFSLTQTWVGEMSYTYSEVPTLVQVSDTGTSTETIGFPLKSTADTGTGSDRIGFPAKSVADSGTGSESGLSSVLVPLSDSGVGSESVLVSVSYLITVSDSGAGSDGVSSMIKGVGDSGVGTETAQGNMLIPISDSGTGSDSVLMSINIIITDFGFGVENVPFVNLEGTELCVGIDNIERIIELRDTGQGTDTVAVGTLVWLTDSGVGTELVGERLHTPSDMGKGSDTAVLIFYLNDSGVGSDKVERVPHVAILAFLKELMNNGVD